MPQPSIDKSLDLKIDRIRSDPNCGDFILADAKDADMAFGLATAGHSPEHHASEAHFRSLQEYRQNMREITKQGLVDIMLMSASSSEVLTVRERLFDDSTVTPAIRANDTTDIWLAAGTGRYSTQPSRPFASASLDHAMCGQPDCPPDQRHLGVDLGLYSVTFNNDVQRDHESLQAYKQFRQEAEPKGFRHFLEVFAPNACGDDCPEDVPRFVNDHIARTLAGVTSRERPVFLKIPYFGPRAMEALVGYDSSFIVGILGGSAGTTYDAFHMLWDAKRHGARAALFGRKINNAEHQLTFVQHLRMIADGQIKPEEAVRAYHAELDRMSLRPRRPLAEDLQLTEASHSYSGSGSTARQTSGNSTATASRDPEPDFSKMTPAEKVQWNLEKWRRILD